MPRGNQWEHAPPLASPAATTPRPLPAPPRPAFPLAVAAAAYARRDFTALSVITLACRVCGEGVKGEADARAHATRTGHAEFDEAREPATGAASTATA